MNVPIHTVTTTKGEFIFVEIPDDGILFIADMGYLQFKTPNYDTWVDEKDLWNIKKMEKHLKKYENSDEWKATFIKLPDGDFKFLAATKTLFLDKHEASQNLTEEIAVQIVGDNGTGWYEDYRTKNTEVYTSCATASASVKSLMESAAIPTDKSYAILQLKK